MENQRSQTTTQSSQTNSDVTTWELPEGAIARLGRGVIRDIAISPEKRSIAVATHIGTWIYDLDSKQPVALLDTDRGMVGTVTLSNDGQWIATHNGDGIIKIHETDTCQCVAKIKGWYKGTSHLAFSPDNQYVVASGNGYGDVYLWCRNTGNYVNRFKVEGRVEGKLIEGEKLPTRYPFCLSPNGKLLAYISRRSTLSVRNLTKKDCFARIGPFRKATRTGYVHDIAFSPCSQFLAASIRDLNTRKNIEVQVWNIDQETLETTYTDFVGTRVRVAFTPDGILHVADVYDDKAVIWNACQREKLATLEYQAKPEAVCFSANGQLCSIITSREISVWDADYSITVIPIQEPSTPSNAMFFSQSDKVLVCKHWSESKIVFWNVSKRQRIRTPIEANSTGKVCALSPCEELLAIIGEDRRTLEVWNITSGTQIAELSEHQSYIPTLVFSPTGEHLFSGDIDGKLVLWNVQRWEKQHSLMGQAEEIRTAVFHPNGQQFATADAAGYHLWDVASKKHLGSPTVNFTLPDASLYKGDIREIQRRYKMKSKMRWLRTVTFSPCGTLIAGGLWGEIRIWDAATLEPRIGMLLPESCYRVGVLVFSPCGRYLVSGTWWNGTDKTSIRIWEVATWENIRTFWGHPSDIQNLAFSKNGELLASSSYEGTILLWDMKPFICT